MRKNIALDRWELFSLKSVPEHDSAATIDDFRSHETSCRAGRDSRGSLPTAAQRADSFA
jgi:hypothetical protein